MNDDLEIIKIVLVGEKGVGKGDIIKLFIGKTNKSLGRFYKSDFGSLIIVLDDKKIKLIIYNASPNRESGSQAEYLCKNASAVILVYNKAIKGSFEAVENFWIKKVKEVSPKNIIIAIIENKENLYNSIDDIDLNKSIEYKFANENGDFFDKVSVKKKITLINLFIGIAREVLKKEKIINETNEKEINEIDMDIVKDGQGCCCRII